MSPFRLNPHRFSPHRFVKLGLPLLCATTMALGVQYGCGSSGDVAATAGSAAGGNGAGANSAGGGSASGGNGAGSAVGGNGSGGFPSGSGNGGADFTYDPPLSGNGGGGGGSCVDETAAADALPLDIYFMLDMSGSMDEPLSNGDCNVTNPPGAPAVNSKWCKAINAIYGYAVDVASTGNRAAIEFFNGGTCTGYDTPAQTLVDLPAQAGLLETAMNGGNPTSSTPTAGALNGLTAFTAANETPGRVMIGVLITDGDPTTCSPTSDSGLANIVSNHFTNTGIHTFVVGMDGATFSRLEDWADYTGAISHDDTNDACGNGAGPCYHYNVGDGDPAVFIAALQQIQNSVVGCTFAIPQPATGLLDPNSVIVEYLPAGNPPAQVLPRVNDMAACGAGDGWYYDDNTTPTSIHLCPTSCTTVQADAMAEIKFRIDCQGS